MDGWMYGWKDRWMDAWMDAWMDGCMHACIDTYTILAYKVSKVTSIDNSRKKTIEKKTWKNVSIAIYSYPYWEPPLCCCQPWRLLRKRAPAISRERLRLNSLLRHAAPLPGSPWKYIWSQHLEMDQYLLIAFLVGWTSIYQGFDPSPSDQSCTFFSRRSELFSWLIAVIEWWSKSKFH